MTPRQLIEFAFVLAGASLLSSGYRITRGTGPALTRNLTARMTQPFTWVFLIVSAGGIAALLMLVIPS